MSSKSTGSKFEALSGPRVQIRGIDRVESGYSANLHLRARARNFDAPEAALVLAKRGLSLRAAHAAVTRLVEVGRTVVSLPALDGMATLTDALTACGIEATPYGAPDSIDVRAIRNEFQLSQEEFALRFGLDVASLRNWEQGRSAPDRATRSFLLMIWTHPDMVQETLRAYGMRPATE